MCRTVNHFNDEWEILCCYLWAQLCPPYMLRMLIHEETTSLFKSAFLLCYNSANPCPVKPAECSLGVKRSCSWFFWKGSQKRSSLPATPLSVCKPGCVYKCTHRASDTLCVTQEQCVQHSHQHCRIRFDHRHLKCKERTIHLSWDKISGIISTNKPVLYASYLHDSLIHTWLVMCLEKFDSRTQQTNKISICLFFISLYKEEYLWHRET